MDRFRIWRDCRFEAAHRLPHVPDSHKCFRMHGHSYRVRATITGPMNKSVGWIFDHGTLGGLMKTIIENRLDHRCLNEISGLENPTAETLAAWIGARLQIALPPSIVLESIEIQETANAGIIWLPESLERIPESIT